MKHCCGRSYTEINYRRHTKTQTHQKWLKKEIERLENLKENPRDIEIYKRELIQTNNSDQALLALKDSMEIYANNLYEKIKKIKDIKIQEQFGENENIISLNIRISKGESIDDYRENVQMFEEVLEKVIKRHKISLTCKAKFIKQNTGDIKYHNLQSNTQLKLFFRLIRKKRFLILAFHL